MAIERTLIIIKPDGVQRGLVGEILNRLERRGLKIVGLDFRTISEETASTHYGEHKGKGFYDDLIRYITSGPVVAMVLQGESSIASLRRLCGAAKVEEAMPGTIRGDFAMHTDMNIIHASDSPASAEREIGLFFKPDEIFAWSDGNDAWI